MDFGLTLLSGNFFNGTLETPELNREMLRRLIDLKEVPEIVLLTRPNLKVIEENSSFIIPYEMILFEEGYLGQPPRPVIVYGRPVARLMKSLDDILTPTGFSKIEKGSLRQFADYTWTSERSYNHHNENIEIKDKPIIIQKISGGVEIPTQGDICITIKTDENIHNMVKERIYKNVSTRFVV